MTVRFSDIWYVENTETGETHPLDEEEGLYDFIESHADEEITKWKFSVKNAKKEDQKEEGDFSDFANEEDTINREK